MEPVEGEGEGSLPRQIVKVVYFAILNSLVIFTIFVYIAILNILNAITIL